MKNRQRLFFAFLLLLCLPAVFCSAVFAAETTTTPWYNMLTPNGIDLYLWMNNTEYYQTYSNFALFDNDLETTQQLGFIFGDENDTTAWSFPYSGAYDYYATISVSGYGYEEDFTFYPNEFRVTCFNHDETFESYNMEDLKITHYDSTFELGFLVTGKIPEVAAGNKIRSFFVRNTVSGTVPSGLLVNIYISQVPKAASSGSADTEQILSAIQAQTKSLQNTMNSNINKLYNVTEMQKTTLDFELDDAYTRFDQEVLDQLFSERIVTENLVDQLMDNTEPYQVYFPGVRGPFLPGGETATIIEPQFVDMSFMEEFQVITDAVGLLMLGLCGWRTLEFLHDTAMRIFGREDV